uniref:Polycystin_dom domain-containing protein n=1 Tax=Ascaris lumbricoides TaxID=6252 RepID=A0A0M3IK00_ASCLU
MPLSKNELSPTKDATCAPPTLQGSVYDADTLDIPPPIATPRAHPAALEAEEYEDDKYNKNPNEKDAGKGKLFINGIKGSLLDALYWQQTDVAAYDDTQVKMLLQGSRLLGSPRLRMLKVNNHSCTIVSSFKREIRECFGPYTESAEDREPFGPANNSAFVSNYFKDTPLRKFLFKVKVVISSNKLRTIIIHMKYG